mmetsp:Transcript_28166/g.51301  ORF Transcript_28166/g.51301 Transcript_28166/m.51301 type:complete len:598 (-) Transcript_28166:380-2173(-)
MRRQEKMVSRRIGMLAVAATACVGLSASVVEGTSAVIEDASASSNNLRRKRRPNLFQVNEPLSEASERLVQLDQEELLFSDVLEESNEIFRHLMVSGSGSGGPPDPCPDRAAFLTERVLEEEWATPAELSDPSSPQSLALSWMIGDEVGTPCDLPNLDQRYGAAVFYYALDGDGWVSSTSWLSTAPVCDWFGINCNSSGLLTEIDLGENNLTGSLPPQLELFVKMLVLKININNVGGSIPESLTAMTNLKSLDMEMNDLTGPVVPAFISNSSLGSTLTSYRVSFNDLTGEIPVAVGDELPNLVEFWLAGNEEVTGTLPDSIGSLTKLETFFVYNTTIEGTLPATIGNMASLSTLDLAFTEISGIIPNELFDASSLTQLYLNSLKMEGTISTRIGQLSGLTDMWLTNNTFSGTIPNELYQLTNMQTLLLANNKFTGSLEDSFGSWSNIRFFDVSINELVGTLPTSLLTSKETLRNVYMQNNTFTGTIPASFTSLSNLRDLYLFRNQLDGTVPTPGGNQLKKLQEFFFSENDLTGVVPVQYCNLRVEFDETTNTTIDGPNNGALERLWADCAGIPPQIACPVPGGDYPFDDCCTFCNDN